MTLGAQPLNAGACYAQERLAREDGGPAEAAQHSGAGAPCLFTRTPSLEQAGGLQRMTLRGHTGGISKVLLTPGGIDIITSAPPGLRSTAVLFCLSCWVMQACKDARVVGSSLPFLLCAKPYPQ